MKTGSFLLLPFLSLLILLFPSPATPSSSAVDISPDGSVDSTTHETQYSQDSVPSADIAPSAPLEVPTIDIAPLLAGSRDPSYHSTLASLISAATTYGFFHITNHGVSPGLIRKNKEAMKEFFSMDEEIKQLLERTVGNSRGWSKSELTKNKLDIKELFDYGMVLPPDGAKSANPFNEGATDIDSGLGSNQWPTHITSRSSNLSPPTVPLIYMNSCTVLAHKLLNLLLTELHIKLPDDDATIASPKHHTSYNRWNYYPSTEVQPFDVAAPLGISPHTDAGLLTLLHQDPKRAEHPQLQVYSGSKEVFNDGVWIPVPPCPTDQWGFTVNVGDMLQVISKGYYKAPEHRVVRTPGPSTYSSALFYNPAYGAVIKDDKGVGEEHYRDLYWAGYRRRRWEGDFKDVGEEVQIEAYRESF